MKKTVKRARSSATAEGLRAKRHVSKFVLCSYKAGVKSELLDTVKARKLALLWLHHEETRELPGERDNARNNARCTQTTKSTHGLDGQHQYMDRTIRERVNQNDRDKWRKYVHGVANLWIEDG